MIPQRRRWGPRDPVDLGFGPTGAERRPRSHMPVTRLILSGDALLPIQPRLPNAVRGIRTLTEPGLSRSPLPVGIREYNVRAYTLYEMGRPGLEPGMQLSHGFTARCDTNSAHRPIKKPPAWNSSLTDGLYYFRSSSDKSYPCHCFTGVLPHANKTLLLSRRDR